MIIRKLIVEWIRVVSVFWVTLTVFGSAFGEEAIAYQNWPRFQGVGRQVVLDQKGNVYVVGQFSGQRDFNPSEAEDLKKSNGGTDVYVTCFKADGTYSWTQTLGGIERDYGSSIALHDETLFIAGTLNHAKEDDGTLDNASGYDAFLWALSASDGMPVVKFNSGKPLVFGGSKEDRARCVLAKSDIVYLAGYFNSSDAGIGGKGVLSAKGNTTGFVLAVDSVEGKAVEGFGQKGVVAIHGDFDCEIETMVLEKSHLYVGGRKLTTSQPGQIRSFRTPRPFLMELEAINGIKNDLSDLLNEFTGSIITLTCVEDSLFAAPLFKLGDIGVCKINRATRKLNSAFGKDGIQILSGTHVWIRNVKADGEHLYCLGNCEGIFKGTEGKEIFKSARLGEVYLTRMQTSSGNVDKSFGSNGFVFFGNSSINSAENLFVSNEGVHVLAHVIGDKVVIHHVAEWSLNSFYGVYLHIKKKDGAILPVAREK